MNAQRLADRFLAVARRQPATTALICGEDRIGYGELADRAVRLADRLGPLASDAPMALHAAKTPGIVTAMLACLVAGVPYVPVDPRQPGARRGMILTDSGARLLLVDDTASPVPPPDTGGAQVTVMGMAELDTLPAGTLTEAGRPEAGEVAGVLYTSGSTGTPKGVLTTHRNAVTFLRWAQDLIGVEPGDVIACYAPLHFDMHVFDLFGTLSQGATVLLVDDRTILFPEAVCRLLRKERTTSMYAVPMAWQGLLRSAALRDGGLPSLRTLMYSGEEFPVRPLRELAGLLPGVRIVNIYGPVETNAVTALEVTDEHLAMDRIPIGLPFGDSRVFLLADDGRVVTEPGAQGEITVSTPTLAAGYLNDSELTAASRTTVESDGERYEVYRTGDYGCWDGGGLLHFRGRRDGRTKIRGFRVELGEVETRLSAHPGVREAVVCARADPGGGNELIAFITPRPGRAVASAELASWSREALPGYMVPREIRVLDALPMTSTGKADRAMLRLRAAAPGSGSGAGFGAGPVRERDK